MVSMAFLGLRRGDDNPELGIRDLERGRGVVDGDENLGIVARWGKFNDLVFMCAWTVGNATATY